MARRASLTTLTEVVELVGLICLTFVLAFLGLVLSRSGPGMWFVAACIGIPLWLGFALRERSDRQDS